MSQLGVCIIFYLDWLLFDKITKYRALVNPCFTENEKNFEKVYGMHLVGDTVVASIEINFDSTAL